ncbi:Uncharacterized protein SCG7109_AA_00370 [Chlamydiales bacterium SCGC AG-110-M15]|nr:Uncharacterized protein SCG7109_AA_00370 [Chlamydiales bacterium SCGC AG-110-M15]
MERQKPWQLFLIIAVLVLTIYNILPTVFYYNKPLREPLEESRAQNVAVELVERVNALEQQSLDWVASYCKHLGTNPSSINLVDGNPRVIKVSFDSPKEAELLTHLLPRAGEMIPFPPAQLSLSISPDNTSENAVYIERRVAVRLDPARVSDYLTFSPKKTANGKVSDFYRDLIYDRADIVLKSFAGESIQARRLNHVLSDPSGEFQKRALLDIARDITEFNRLFGESHPITLRFYRSYLQTNDREVSSPISSLINYMKKAQERYTHRIDSIETTQRELEKDGERLDFNVQQELTAYKKDAQTFDHARRILKNHESIFSLANQPLDLSSIDLPSSDLSGLQSISFADNHPFFKSLLIDWENDSFHLDLHDDVLAIRNETVQSESDAFLHERLNQLIINEVARVSRQSDEQIKPTSDGFSVDLNTLTNSQSLLAFDLGSLAEEHRGLILDKIRKNWTPSHRDLNSQVFPVVDTEEYQSLPLHQKKIALVVYAPSADKTASFSSDDFHNDSIYVIARGITKMIKKYESNPDSDEARTFADEFQLLANILQQDGFTAYRGSILGEDSPYRDDFIFKLSDYYSNLLAATRENFTVHGTKRYAVLEFTDYEQRLLTQNRIEKAIHEDLLKWRDDYQASQVELDLSKKSLVPPITKSPLFENLKLNARKYFRGDEQRILKWGLDLSGGKMVRIGLRDQNNLPVTDEASLTQGINELTQRVNKMGLAEVDIRSEGNVIVLEFPGSQGFSGSELVQASSMYFHIVNEKFGPFNPELSSTVGEFLQDVWNEAVVTNRMDVNSVNEIAWTHLGGEQDGDFRPKTEIAQKLFDAGLRLPSPKGARKSTAFDDTLSAITLLRGDDHADWEGRMNPLMIVFHNYALEGSNLASVQAGYDPERGNILSFSVSSSYSKENQQGGISPQNDFYTWTSQFAQDGIVGTEKEKVAPGSASQKSGWRMAVILNGQVISHPTLSVGLRNNAMIHGKFTQREVNHLVADLKAGSLSFTPQILEEMNISPELGKSERNRGMLASIVGIFLVVLTMVAYYRFSGVVASIAVLFNLLIMWGVLQNLDAALTLAGIAGIILTVGMAVDANVLVFERIREEFSHSGRIATAIQTGYRKAFSAIIDSNITTIIAALILMQFDSGPIKGFAITLIVGIASSMFTALFVTRYYFAGWVRNSKNKELKMSNLFGGTAYNFLSKAKLSLVVSTLVIVVGLALFVAERQTLIGMDFTGGYSLTLQVDEKEDVNYRAALEDALYAQGAQEADFQVRQLNTPNHLRIQYGTSIEEEGHPFYQMPNELMVEGASYRFENNPRIAWTVGALADAGMTIDSERLEDLDNQWHGISGQFSDVMLKNALIGLGIALFSILVYITLRFEFKYAVSAILGLGHDVVISLGILAIFHRMGMPVQVNMETIAAVMTIIGYSLNDTIIIFDRIREDSHIMRKRPFAEIVNHSLNVTLSRTFLTSGTTLSVLIALLLFGGSMIFDFVLVMTIGVVIGTLSSWFIVSPIMIYFHDREAELKPVKQT